MEKFMEAVGYLVVFCVLILWSTMFDAWVISTLYQWFVVSLFESAPVMTLAQTAGVLLVLRMVRGLRSKESKKTEGMKEVILSLFETVLTSFLLGFFVLAVGFCIKQFLP